MEQIIKVVDMHCDTISKLYDKQHGAAELNGKTSEMRRTAAENIRSFSGQLNLDKMKSGGYGVQNFALFVHRMEHKEPLEYGMQLLDAFYEELEAFPEEIGITASWEDIERNWNQNRMSALLTMEEGGICQGRLCHLRNFYRLGVRMMTLTWNFANELAWPNRIIWEGPHRGTCLPELEYGLTDTGAAFVEEMERLGIVIDISHLGDRGIWQVFERTTGPLVASHSNARAVAAHPRNLTDEMIRTLSERGGVTGLSFCAAFLRDWNPGEKKQAWIQDMIQHVRHLYQVGGIDCIGLGSDFDGIPDPVEFGDASGIQLLAQALERDGFTIGQIEAIFHKNVLRVYREIL